MAQPYVTGPAHVFARVGAANTTILHLGTTERTPKILIRPAWEPVFNDMGGKVPFDVAYEGEEAFVSGDFNRFNESVYRAMASRASFVADRGFDPQTDIGSLMLTEGLTFELWVIFPYSPLFPTGGGKAAMNDMPPGYHFFNAYLVGPDELEPLGTTPRKERLIWHCLRGVVIGNSTTVGNTTTTGLTPPVFQLYDHDMTALVGVSIT